MKRFIVALAVVVLTACASLSTPNGKIAAAYDTVNAYVQTTGAALVRGRITPDQAARASANAKRARDAVDAAAITVADCKPPCDATAVVQALQPMLLELEAELRKREGETK